MSRFKTKSKQALTVILALLLFFAMVPSSLPGSLAYADTEWGNVSAESTGVTLATDKTSYDVGEDIRYHIAGIENASGKYDPWLGLYRYGGDYQTSMHYEYVGNVDDENLLAKFGDYIDEGKYHLVISTGDTGTQEVWATLDFTVESKWGNISTESTGVTLATDKATYNVGEDIRYHIAGIENASGTWDPWLGIYEYGGSYEGSIKYIYPEGNVDDNSFLEDFEFESLEAGKYHLILSTGGNGYQEVWATLDITIGEYKEPTITLNKEGTIPQYKYGEPVMITAESSDPTAWFGVYNYDGSGIDGAKFPNGSYARFDIKDVTESIDLVQAAIDNETPLTYGEMYRIYLCILEGSNPNSIQFAKSLKFELLVTYLDGDDQIDWTLSEDKTKATATFHRADDTTQTVVFEDIPVTNNGVTKDPTCTEAGEHQYTANFAFTEENALVTVNGNTEFTHVFKESVDALGHDFNGRVEVVVQPTEEQPGLERHYCTRCDAYDDVIIPEIGHRHSQHLTYMEPTAPTCTESGNIEFWSCTCGKFFSDPYATEEVTDIVVPALGHAFGEWTVTTEPTCTETGEETRTCSRCKAKETREVKATGHAWGDWTFDEETKTHTRVCTNDPAHKETENCTFTYEPSSDPNTDIGICTVCGGRYEQLTVPVITLDKEDGVYELGEDILVTTELNGVNGDIGGGWIALQYKGESYDNKSLLWYYPACFDNPKKLQSVLTPSDTNKENVNGDRGTDVWTEIPVGEYELVFLDTNYKKVGNPTYFTVVKGVESEKVTKEPTCTEKGIKHIVYKDGTGEDVEIDALGHDPKTEWVYDSKQRVHYHECSRCEERVGTAACTFDEGKVTKEPTATTEGEKLYTCTVCGGTYTEVIPTLADQGVKRIYGDTRYQTAMLQADALKEYLGVEKFDTIIVATGTNYADALSGAYLGYVKAAPILLVRGDVVSEVKDYIKANLNEGGTVYLLGGEAVVPAAVTDGIAGAKTERLFGATRYETNIEILKAAGVKNEAILVCDGRNFADSLSASAAKLPILLVRGALNDVQKKYLNTLPGNDYYLIGGTGVLPTALENDINSNYGAVERLGGADRYETSTKVAEKFFEKPEKAVVAYAMNYPDGLCGGTLAAYMNAPLLLVRNDKVSITEKYSKEAGIKSGIVLGGSALVSDDAVRGVFEMKDTDEIYVVNKMVPMNK